MNVVTDLQPNPWAAPNGRRRWRIHQELRYLGETRRWWSDACRFIEDDTLETGAHMALHALRELNGTLLDLFVPIANVTEDPEHAKERQRLAEVLADAGFTKDVTVGAQGRLPPGAKEKIGAVCRMLDLDAEIEETWSRLELHQAHRRNLGMRTITDPSVVAAFNDAERVIAAIAERWAQHYPTWFALVDEIAAGDPSKENVKRLLDSVPPIYELLSRFFGSIDNPLWLPPLRAQGLLTRVPPPEVSDDETKVRYLPWPAAPFLASVAEQAPGDVQPLLEEVASSDNPLALHAVIDIAAKLPVELAAALVPAIADGVVRWRGIGRPTDLVGALVRQLVGGGAHDNALRLAGSVLALDGANHVGGDFAQEYERLLAEVVHALHGVDRDAMLSMLFDVLADASGTGGDRSVVWLRKVDEPTRRHHDSRPVLAAKITELTERLALDGRVEVLGGMVATGVPAVQRIALHLARVHAAIEPTVVLEDMSALGGEELRLEVGELVRDRWDDLGGAATTRYLDFVAAGPPVEILDKTEDSEQYTRQWRGHYLQPILDKLDRNDAQVADLLAITDVPAYEVLRRFEFRSKLAEHDSPWSAEELLTLNADALIDRIKDFPEAGVGSPNWRGLGDVLTVVVAQDIHRYRTLPGAVSSLAPEIIHGAIAGVAQAARREPIDWNVVLDAALAGVQWSGAAGDGWDDFDEPRPALRYQALAAIHSRLRHDEPLPNAVIAPIVEVIRICIEDEQPGDGPGLGLGPVGELPHTVRNVALDTLVDAISAVARTGEVSNSVAGAMLREALENEANPYVFAQAAQRAHRLAADAPGWLRDHVDLVFGPPGSDDLKHRVAWEVMSFQEPPDGILAGLLVPHYTAWIDALTGEALDEHDRRLAAHVGALAVASLLSPDTVERFFAVAPVDGRTAALAYAVPAADDEVDAARLLWERRAAAVAAGGDPLELSAITSWLHSALLPPGWLLDQLERATRLATPIERPDIVLIHLSPLGTAVPEAGDVVLDVLERVLAQADPHQLAWSSEVVVGIIDDVAKARDDLRGRVGGARATAALRLQDPGLLAAGNG